MNRPPRLMVAAVLTAASVALAACGDDTDQPVSTPSSVATNGSSAASDYCTTSGGEPHVARPSWNTNADPSDWLGLAGSVELCRFQTDETNPDEQTRIYVDLDTLYSTDPTLAGVAYLSKVAPTLPDRPSANPANANCTALGGSSQMGAGASGGGWVTDDRPTEVFSLCVFPDLSFIDEFGILYYADGTVRGKDLSTVMRYDPARLPPIFGS